MNKRLTKILSKAQNTYDSAMIDLYNQSIREDISCTIQTNINTANNHFIMEKIEIVGHKHKGQSGVIYGTNGISPTITTLKGEGAKIIVEEPVVLGWTRDSKGNIVNRHPVEISNTITSAKRDNTQNYVVDPTTIQRGHGYNQGKEFKDVIPTITGSTWHFNNILKLGYRIRKYTERECFRLMGVADSDSDKIREVVSKSQCYKLAGNSIVVDVLAAIFQQLFTENKTTDRQLKLF